MKVDISFIVPLYKGMDYISKKINLLKHMKTKNQIELIFVNDEVDCLVEEKEERITDNLYVKWIQHKKNEGIHRSRLDGFVTSSGKYICFLDQDDELTEDYIVSQCRFFQEDAVDAVICNGIWRKTKQIFDGACLPHQFTSIEDYLTFGYPITSLGQLVIRKDSVPRLWKDCIVRSNGCDDLLLWIMLLDQKNRITVNDKLLYYHVENGENASLDFRNMADSIEECCSIVEERVDCEAPMKESVLGKIRDRQKKYELYAEFCETIRKITREDLTRFLKKRHWEKIAIYGYGILGRVLAQKIDRENIRKMYFIEKSDQIQDASERILKWKDPWEEVDVVIVTPLAEYSSLERSIKERLTCVVVSALDVVKDVADEIEG